MKSLFKNISLWLLLFICFLSGMLISEYRNRNLQKYRPLDAVLQEMSKRNYDYDNYNCLNFSQDTQSMLVSQGIKSTIIVGENQNKPNDHAFLGIWIDPQTGTYVQDWDYKRVYNSR